MKIRRPNRSRGCIKEPTILRTKRNRSSLGNPSKPPVLVKIVELINLLIVGLKKIPERKKSPLLRSLVKENQKECKEKEKAEIDITFYNKQF